MAKTALIVDDSTSIRQMVALTLKSAGFHVVEGGNGQEALDKLALQEGRRVDLIVTDLNMPIMDGLTFVREVRRQAESLSTPILMLTTENQESFKAAGREAGASAWIVKPFNPERLLKVIEKVLPA